MSAALDFTYHYAFSSGLQPLQGRPKLTLATCNADLASPYFFEGRVRSPRVMADMLLTLSDIVRTHFFLPRPILLDPVLTSNERLLRLEGFSGCCGVYARADLPAEAFDGECRGRGTTNVDFNMPMRNALMRLRDHEEVRFAVGRDEVALSRDDERIVEKKVKLPLRWIKGFSEVQAYQPGLTMKMEVGAAQALRFIRSLPKAAKPKMPGYAVYAGGSLRMSQRPGPGAVPVVGTHRVKVIEALLPRARTLRIWSSEDGGTSAWEVCFPLGSFFLMISPEVYRGFSGEGQVLNRLAKPPSDALLAGVRAQLTWQSEIDAAALAANLKVEQNEVETALAVLGSRGLAGFDASKACYFHRELPFDLDRVEALQPRLQNARKLVEQGMVERVDDGFYRVAGTGIDHRVSLNGDGESCSCPWFSKYLGGRGPCKHILAAQLLHEVNDDAGTA